MSLSGSLANTSGYTKAPPSTDITVLRWSMPLCLPAIRCLMGHPPLWSSPCLLLANHTFHLCGVVSSGPAHPALIPVVRQGPQPDLFAKLNPTIPSSARSFRCFSGLGANLTPSSWGRPQPHPEHTQPIPAPAPIHNILGATLTWRAPPLPGGPPGFLPTPNPCNLQPRSASQYFEFSPCPAKYSARSPAHDDFFNAWINGMAG